MPPKTSYQCPEEKRLSRIEAQVNDVLLDREIPHIKRKIDEILKKINNGLMDMMREAKSKSDQNAHDIKVLQGQIVRPLDPSTGSLIERREKPPDPVEPLKQGIKDRWQQKPWWKKLTYISLFLGIIFKEEIREMLSTAIKTYLGIP